MCRVQSRAAALWISSTSNLYDVIGSPEWQRPVWGCNFKPYCLPYCRLRIVLMPSPFYLLEIVFDGTFSPRLGEILLMVFPVPFESTHVFVCLRIQKAIMIDIELVSRSSHLSGSIWCQDGSWDGDGNLIVKLAAEEAVADQSLLPIHDDISSIKVQIGNVEKAMDQWKHSVSSAVFHRAKRWS